MKAAGQNIIVKPVYENTGKIHLSDGCIKQLGSLHGIVQSIGPDVPKQHKLKKGDKVVYRHGEGVPLEDGLLVLNEKRLEAVWR